MAIPTFRLSRSGRVVRTELQFHAPAMIGAHVNEAVGVVRIRRQEHSTRLTFSASCCRQCGPTAWHHQSSTSIRTRLAFNTRPSAISLITFPSLCLIQHRLIMHVGPQGTPVCACTSAPWPPPSKTFYATATVAVCGPDLHGNRSNNGSHSLASAFDVTHGRSPRIGWSSRSHGTYL